MRVSVISDHPPRLCLCPETDVDQKVLGRLLKSYLIMGYGRSVEGKHLHMNIPLCKLGAMETCIAEIRSQSERINGEKVVDNHIARSITEQPGS